MLAYRALQRAEWRQREYPCPSFSTTVLGGVNQRALCALKLDFQLISSLLWPCNRTQDGIVDFIEDQRSFVKKHIAAMEDSEIESIAKTIGQYLCGLIAGLSKDFAVRGANSPDSEKHVGPGLPLSPST